MKDNCYAYAIDLSLRKGKDGQYSEPLIFEFQPFLSSNLGGSSKWSYKNALEKAFPDSNITIDIQGKKVNVYLEDPIRHILIKNSEELSPKDFINIQRGKYTYVHTGSFEVEIDKLNNKVYQRLYLPDEVSPEYRILESGVATEKLEKEISHYFGDKRISKIVLKSAIGHEGQGNVFVDMNNEREFHLALKKIQELNYKKYFLAEEQKEFPRINRKTGENKPYHLTYRLVGIANSEGDVSHFIATKSISTTLDSHQRGEMKCYFGEPGKINSKAKWTLKASGPKDKYFGKGENKIDIDPTLMDKISKNMYQLYADIKSMTDEEFERHIDSLVELKNSLSSREQRIDQFTLPLVKREEIVNKNDTAAFNRACDADYELLARSIAKEMIISKTVNLKALAEYPDYRQSGQLKTMLEVMEEKRYFKGITTANRDQLKYCFDNKLAPTLSKAFVDAVRAKKKRLANTATQSQITHTTDSPIATMPIPAEVLALEVPPFGIQSKLPPSASNVASRLQKAFFNEPCGSKAEKAPLEAIEETSHSKNKISRLTGLSLFATTPADSDEASKKEKEKQSKLSFAAKHR